MSTLTRTTARATLVAIAASLSPGCTTNSEHAASAEPAQLDPPTFDSPTALCERASALGETKTATRARVEQREVLLADCIDQLDVMLAGSGRASYEALSACLGAAADTEAALACDAPPAIVDLLTLGLPPEAEFPVGFEPQEVCERLSPLMLEHIIEDMGVPASEAWIPQLVESCVIKLHWDLQRLGPQEATQRWTCALAAETGAEMAACLEGSVR